MSGVPYPSSSPVDDDALDALTFGADASAPWDNDSSASDAFLLTTNLRSAAGVAGSDLSSSNLLQNYSLHSLGGPAARQPASSSASTAAPSAAARADDLQSLLSRLSSSRHADLLQTGAATLAEYEEAEFDTSGMLDKMLDDFGADDEEEVAAAQQATAAWGAVPAGYSFDQFAAQQQANSTQIPAPGSQPAPLPNATPSKGAVNLAELEAKLSASAQPQQQQQPQQSQQQHENPALANLPQALHQLVLSGQTAPPGFAPPPQPQQQQQQQQYTGPPLPHFQHGSPAPQGLSVDDRERQHFYIPLPRAQNGGLGFMTKSEVSLVFRIQLSQLQSIGDPLSDDFYYQVMQARKGGKVNSSGQAILPVFKSHGGQQRNEDGSPKLPEGTLGRISAFSIAKPKRLMAIESSTSESAETTAAAGDDEAPRRSNMFAARTLTYLIEEGYRCLMDLEDVDALLASLAPRQFEDPARAFDRQRLQAQRADLCARLVESLDLDEIAVRMREVTSGEHLVFKFYALPKGRLLLYRALVLLNPPHTYQLVDVLMHDLQQVALPTTAAPSTDEKLAHLLSDIVYAMPLLPYGNEIFSYLLAPKHAAQLIPLVRTRLLCQLLQVLLKKGHEATMLLQQNPHVPALRDTVAQWRSIFDALLEGVRGRISELFEGLPKDAKPTLPSTTSTITGGNASNNQRGGARRNQPQGAAKKEAAKDGKEDATAAKEEKKEESKEEKPESAAASAPKENYALSTRFGMWELMAAFFSHANEVQRVWLNAELHATLTKELKNLYGEYAEKKDKQREEAAAAATAEIAAAAEKEKKEAEAAAAAPKDGAEKSEATPATAGAEAADAKKDAASPPAGRERRQQQQQPSVPPASSLPPPPSPALRFLSSALLGEQSPEYQAIARTWGELHGDYSFYQFKHQQKVAQEQARLAQQAQMRQTRQAQQQQQWQAYQQRSGAGGPRGGPNASPSRQGGIPPQHAHFHTSAPHMRGPLQFQHTPLNQQHQHHPSNQQQQQGGADRQQRGGHQQQQQRGGYQQQHGQQQQQQQQQSPPAAIVPPKPVPVWVKPGTTGAAVAKTPVKAPAPAAAASPAK